MEEFEGGGAGGGAGYGYVEAGGEGAQVDGGAVGESAQHAVTVQVVDVDGGGTVGGAEETKLAIGVGKGEVGYACQDFVNTGDL